MIHRVSAVPTFDWNAIDKPQYDLLGDAEEAQHPGGGLRHDVAGFDAFRRPIQGDSGGADLTPLAPRMLGTVGGHLTERVSPGFGAGRVGHFGGSIPNLGATSLTGAVSADPICPCRSPYPFPAVTTSPALFASLCYLSAT